ncbi:hypothetical protein JCM11641_006437 [Rhodosporidiobolus odoratus]
MLSRLPLELVQYIVQLSLPSTTSPLTVRDRQDTLVMLCKKKSITMDEEVLNQAEDGDQGHRVKIIYVNDVCSEMFTSRRDRSEVASSSRMASLLPNLAEARITDREIDLADLAAFPNLQQLILSNSIATASSTATLPALRELLHMCNFFRQLWRHVPSHLSPNLVANPRSMVDFEAFHSASSNPSNLILSGIRNIRLNPHAECGAQEKARSADVTVDLVLPLAEIVAQGHAPDLTFVILPTNLQPSLRYDTFDPAADAFSELRDICR